MTKRAIRVLELRSVRGIGGGPEKTILMGAAQADPACYRVTVCYIRDGRDPLFGVEGRAADLPVEYREIRERHSFDPAVWPALRRLVRECDIDIVHAHDYKTDLLAALLHWHDGLRVMATAHGWSGSTLRERAIYYPADKFVLARLPRVITVSSAIRQQIIAWGGDPARISVVLNGVDHQVFRRDRQREAAAREAFRIGPDDIVIGAVGRLESEKRFDLLVSAVAELCTGHPRVVLVIAGEGALRDALATQMAQLGLSNRGRLLGHVDDVKLLHHALDILVQSSDTEGTPNAVLEAMALETPVVATAVGGTADLVNHEVDGLLTPRGSVDALVQALERTLADPVATRTRTDAARLRVERHLSFGARMQAVEQIYDQLMAAPAGHHLA